MFTWKVAFLTTLAFLYVGYAARGEERPPILLEEGMTDNYTAGKPIPIRGLRKASPSFVSAKSILDENNPNGTEVYIPEKLLVAAWKKDPSFAMQLASKNIGSSNSIDQFTSQGIEIQNFDWLPADTSSKSVKPIKLSALGLVPKSKASTDDIVDASAIIAMTRAGQIDLSKPYYVKANDNPQRVYKTSEVFAKSIPQTYGVAKTFQDYPLSKPGRHKAEPANYVFPFKNYNDLFLDIGSATFGLVRVQTAQEAGLTLSNQIKTNQETYLLRFAVTFRDIPITKLSEVSFRVRCVSACTAWELAPSKIVEIQDETRKYKTPSVGFKGLSIGEFFERQVVTKSLKPIIIAYGAQEDEFSWSLKDQAIQDGAMFFAAAVSVPKGTKQLQIERWVDVKTNGFIGLLEGDFGTTGPYTDPIPLAN